MYNRVKNFVECWRNEKQFSLRFSIIPTASHNNLHWELSLTIFSRFLKRVVHRNCDLNRTYRLYFHNQKNIKISRINSWHAQAAAFVFVEFLPVNYDEMVTNKSFGGGLISVQIINQLAHIRIYKGNLFKKQTPQKLKVG